MKYILALLAVLILAQCASAQNVTVIGPVTSGNVPQFNSTTVIKDSGIPASALPTGLANPTGAIGLTVVNGAASTAMRSDAAPPLSASVQTSLTATNGQILTGTGVFGFSSGVVGSIPGITINPTAATINQGFNISQSGPTSATGVSAQNFYNQLTITTGANNTSGQPASGFFFSYTNGGANAKGSIWAEWIDVIHNSASVQNGDHIGLVSRCLFSAANTGTGGCYGANPQALLLAGAGSIGEVAAMECDTSIANGGPSATWRFGCAAVSTGPVTGSTLDSAYEIGSASSGGQWLNGLILNSGHGFAALASTGCVICSDGVAETIAKVIDLGNYTISGNIFNFSNFKVSGAGVVTGRYVGGGGGITIGSCTGLGSTGTCTKVAGSVDNAGQITLSPSGTGIAGTGNVTMTFSAALGVNGSSCTFTTANGSAAWNPPSTVTAVTSSTAAFTFAWLNNGNAGTALTSGSTYLITYICMGF